MGGDQRYAPDDDHELPKGFAESMDRLAKETSTSGEIRRVLLNGGHKQTRACCMWHVTCCIP